MSDEDDEVRQSLERIKQAHAEQDAKVVKFDPKRKRGGSHGRRPPTSPPTAPPPGGWPPWHGQLRRDDRGRIIADLANALIALTAEVGFRAFVFDEMLQAMKLLAHPPIVGAREKGADPPRLAEPEDTTRAQEWLQVMGIARLGRDNVTHALELMARERSIHPLRDWLSGLEWDGEPRKAEFLHKALGCADDEYHRQVGGMFLTAMVARIFEPGCQADYMIVLEGPQGEEKSRFCRALASDEYFSDHLPNLHSDPIRVSMHLRGKWLGEISELSAFNKAESSTLKAFLSRRVEIYTPKYGRDERREPRQILFIGTTNDDDYIRDDTGGRRFWPVKVVKVSLDWLRENRDQLFAEAVADYREGKPWWPDREFEKTTIAPIQSDRQQFDNWTDNVLEVVGILTEVSIAGIWRSMNGEMTKLDMVAQKRIGAILKKAGFKKGLNHYGRSVWRKPES